MDYNFTKDIRMPLLVFVLVCISSGLSAQHITMTDYSKYEKDGIVIHNSYNKGGPYYYCDHPYYNCSHLVYFSRVVNNRKEPVQLRLHFDNTPIPIPGSEGTYVKFFLPDDEMSLDKREDFGYGFTKLESLDEATSFEKEIDPNGDCLFYVVALFYQNEGGDRFADRGGNRAELIIEGDELFYKMVPQVEKLACGSIR